MSSSTIPNITISKDGSKVVAGFGDTLYVYNADGGSFTLLDSINISSLDTSTLDLTQIEAFLNSKLEEDDLNNFALDGNKVEFKDISGIENPTFNNVIVDGDIYVKGNIFTDNNVISANDGLFQENLSNYVLPSEDPNTSDGRLKHNKKNINNAIDTILKIQPKTYFKTDNLYDINHTFKTDDSGNPIDDDGNPIKYTLESGVVAQDLMNIPELKHTVLGEEYKTITKTINKTNEHGEEITEYIEEKKPSILRVNYNGLLTYTIKAVQELKKENDEYKDLIYSLKKRVEALENQK